MSSLEFKEAEITKTKILLHLQPFQKINREDILLAFGGIDKEEIQVLLADYQNWIKNLEHELNTTLSVEDNKQAKASFYSVVYGST